MEILMIKKYYLDRIKWIDENENSIINFYDGNLISKADNKLLLLLFVLIIKSIMKRE